MRHVTASLRNVTTSSAATQCDKWLRSSLEAGHRKIRRVRAHYWVLAGDDRAARWRCACGCGCALRFVGSPLLSFLGLDE